MPANAVHIPEVLMLRVRSAMESKGGYATVAEFIREAVRAYCDKTEKEVNGENNKPPETPSKRAKKKKGWP